MDLVSEATLSRAAAQQAEGPSAGENKQNRTRNLETNHRTIPLGQWLSARGHMSDVYAMIHNSCKMTVMKEQ